ncbi:MAG: hypothetical protein IT323_14705 [Anaerolineae bacterium]|nr:hypothetical protein [Anaerolineae bacterium]
MNRLKMLRWLLTALCLGVALGASAPMRAQGDMILYRNETLGMAFQYPPGWTVRETPLAATVTAGTAADLDALDQGLPPSGLIFSVTMSSLRQLGLAGAGDLAGLLSQLAGEGAVAEPVRFGGASGVAATVNALDQDMTVRTAVLSTGHRRIAIVRGLATQAGWTSGARDWFAVLATTLGFFPPSSGLEGDNITAVLWQLPAPDLTHLTGLALRPGGATLYASDRERGVWVVSGNGVPGPVVRPAEMSSFAGLVAREDGTLIIADPARHALWQLTPDGVAQVFVGGVQGEGRGEFGPDAPAQFDTSPRGFFVLDQSTTGFKIHPLSTLGRPATAWDYSQEFGPVDAPHMAVDFDGNIHIVARNTNGIIRLDANGNILAQNLGAEALAGAEPLALVVDGFRNMFVATSDRGILQLEPDGALKNVIGEPYDAALPPKTGQIARPVALAIASDGGPLYVADGGPFPQIVAFVVDGKPALNLEAGTRDGGPISLGAPVTGQITADAFMWTYSFDGRAGDVVTITLRAAENSPLDPFVDLVGPQRRRLVASDDANAPGLRPTDAQISNFPLPDTGTYTIRATRFGRETLPGEGMFVLTLERGG